MSSVADPKQKYQDRQQSKERDRVECLLQISFPVCVILGSVFFSGNLCMLHFHKKSFCMWHAQFTGAVENSFEPQDIKMPMTYTFLSFWFVKLRSGAFNQLFVASVIH